MHSHAAARTYSISSFSAASKLRLSKRRSRPFPSRELQQSNYAEQIIQLSSSMWFFWRHSWHLCKGALQWRRCMARDTRRQWRGAWLWRMEKPSSVYQVTRASQACDCMNNLQLSVRQLPQMHVCSFCTSTGNSSAWRTCPWQANRHQCNWGGYFTKWLLNSGVTLLFN